VIVIGVRTKPRGSALLAAVVSCAVIYANAQATKKDQFRVITVSGEQIASIFDGLAPNKYVRDALILKTNRFERPNAAGSGTQRISRMLRKTLISETPVYLSCPSGGVCAQPGTASAPGQFCEDLSGCGVDAHNQRNTDDFTNGTLETYECEQCCVDWVTCPIGIVPPPPPPPPPDKCQEDPDQDPSCPPLVSSESPIIIDTIGSGFHLTSSANGVLFDMRGDGRPVKLGWTAASSGNAFLALPGSDSTVTNGTQLFGNFTPQPPSPRPNGFAALAVYDQSDHGGNGDGVIDQRDQIFSSLRLWIDENHDGICQQQELHTLPELGVLSLSLEYALSHRIDEFGNVFRYRATVNPGKPGDPDVGRKAYDVFLTTH